MITLLLILKVCLIVVLAWGIWLDILDQFWFQPCKSRIVVHQAAFLQAKSCHDEMGMRIALHNIITDANRMRVLLLLGLCPHEVRRWLRGQSKPLSHDIK